MYREKRIAVIVPAHNEERLIEKAITSIPDYVDQVIVVDDASTDNTASIVKSLTERIPSRLLLEKHSSNKGVGGAIKTGYRKAMELDIDIAAVMAGDAQMNPDELPKLLDPIVEGIVDYAKGNRLVHPERLRMPRFRRFGNSILTLLTKVASGYWGIIDPQNGYAAISKKALEEMEFDNIYDGYGYPNDMLIELNTRNMRVMDVEMPPVYRSEKSGINIKRYALRLSWLLTRGFFRRINTKYGGLHFHPLWLFYMSGIILFVSGLLYSLVILYHKIFIGGVLSAGSVLLPALLLIIGYLSMLFALLFDMDESKELNIKQK